MCTEVVVTDANNLCGIYIMSGDNNLYLHTHA